LAVLSCARGSYGLAEEEVGPDSVRGHPTAEQTGWPAGIVELLRHESRVYLRDVNGDENFYFRASPDEINELIRLFSEARMRDHELWIKEGEKHVGTFNGDEISYNVNLHIIGGFVLSHLRSKESPDTYDPTLTVYVDPGGDEALWKQITLPDNIILNNEVASCPLQGKGIKPERKVWYARVLFNDSTPAADFEHGLSTRIMLWEKDIAGGVKLGSVSREGYFHAAFSDKEIANLEAGRSWLTLTVGNWLTEAKRRDPKLRVERLAPDKQTVQPVRIRKPKFYYGRILFEDGSPPILDPLPWPGAEVRVDFPYAGDSAIDSEGFFKVYFTREQYKKVKAEKVRKNIYVPSYEEKNTSTALFAFPPSKLSQEKKKAGVVRIPRPTPKPNGSETTG